MKNVKKKRLYAIMLAVMMVLSVVQVSGKPYAIERDFKGLFCDSSTGWLILEQSDGATGAVKRWDGSIQRGPDFLMTEGKYLSTDSRSRIYKYEKLDANLLLSYSESITVGSGNTYDGYVLEYITESVWRSGRDSFYDFLVAFLAPVKADVASGTYTSNQTVTLTNAENDEMYYTTDGTNPSKTNGTKYTGPISVEGVAGEKKTVTIKAVSVNTYNDHDYMGDIATYTYDIELPNPSYAVSVVDGTGSESYQAGDTVTITAKDKPGYVFKNWEVVSGEATLADATKKTTTFTMPAGEISVKAVYEKKAEVVKAEIANAKAGDTVKVSMDDTTTATADIFEAAKGKDVTLEFDLGDNAKWTINGKDITGTSLKDIDLSITAGDDAAKAIPVDVVNEVTGEKKSVKLSLAHEGDFGFKAVLNINLEAKNKDLYANLFYYNPSKKALEYICSAKIDEKGNAGLTFTHASDYVIVISDKEFKGVDNAPAASVTNNDDKAAVQSAGAKTGDPFNQAVLILLVLSGVGLVGLGLNKKRR